MFARSAFVLSILLAGCGSEATEGPAGGADAAGTEDAAATTDTAASPDAQGEDATEDPSSDDAQSDDADSGSGDDAQSDGGVETAPFNVTVSRGGFPVDLELGDSLGTLPARTERTIRYSLTHDDEDPQSFRYDIRFMENCDVGISAAPPGPHLPEEPFDLQLIVFTQDVVGRFSAKVFALDDRDRVAATWTLSGSVPTGAD